MVYAPQEGRPDDEKESCYTMLQDTTDGTQKKHTDRSKAYL